MNKKLKRILELLLAAGLCLPLYIFVHELGHLIVMLSAGAEIEHFSIFTAHVTATGGDYTKTSELWLNVNGAFLPVLSTIMYLLFYRKDITGSLYHFFSYMVAMVSIGSMLAWVFIPFLYINGTAPEKDDVTKFLSIFSQYYHPLAVSAAAVVIIVIIIIIIVKKKLIHTVIGIMKEKETSNV